VADDVLRQGVQGVSDLVTLPGLINLDFADVRTIMSNAGNALLGIGMGTGERRAIDAAEAAVASPLLETSMDGARSILLSITGGPDLSLWEVNEAARAVADAAHPDANIIFGAMLDEKLTDGQVWVTVVATGYGNSRYSARDVNAPGQAGHSSPPGWRAAGAAGERSRSSERDWSERDRPGERDRAERRELREPAGEPRVSRRERFSSTELDVPEFIPRR
jgi:cell division protein FtsZ